jgi:hypothetical protein
MMNECMECDERIRAMQELAAFQCAPVIFNIKPSNLLIIDRKYAMALKSLMVSTGVKVRCFDHSSEKQVWFLYREQAMQACLSEPENRSFIASFGYHQEMNLEEIFNYAGRRFRLYKNGQIDFPHEMGIFLGYPLGDVKGFIKNKGRNCLCTGYWKVYENEQKARETFQLYAKVRKLAMEMVQSGAGFGDIEKYQMCM